MHAVAFDGAFAGVRSPLCHALRGVVRLGEEGIVTFLDDFLGCPSEVQRLVIDELAQAGDPQGIRMLEAILWHQDREIVRAALAALGRIRDPLAAGTLQRYLEDGDAAHAGQAQRSLRRLSFVGVEPPPGRVALPFHAGYATAPDGDGYRSLFISRWVAKGKLALLYLQVHERRGLLAAWGVGDLPEEDFEAELDGFALQDDLHPVAPGHVIELLRDALYRSGDLCYLPADFYMRRGMFAGEDLTPAPYRPSFPESPQGRGLRYRAGEEICRELFADPFFAGRLVPAGRVYDLAEECRRGVVTEQVLERVCAELLGPELELIRERLLCSADLMRRCGAESAYVGRVVALARSLDGYKLPHHLHPFLRGFALESMEIAREALAHGAGRPRADEK